jgi:hypothetical protein
MKARFWILVTAFALAACIASAATFTRNVAVNVPEPSFFAVFKVPICVATLAIATPLAGMTGLAGASADLAIDLRADLDDGLRRSCAPSRRLSIRNP